MVQFVGNTRAIGSQLYNVISVDKIVVTRSLQQCEGMILNICFCLLEYVVR